jgi:hypothetical protein
MRFINRKTLAIAGVAAALVAVGSTGTAVAGSLIGSSDIQDGSIRSIDVKDGSLKRADLSNPINRSLARITKDGVQGPKGDKGETGAQGIQGPAGADAQIGTYLMHDSFLIPASGHTEKRVACNEGDIVTGGGYSTNDHNANYSVIHQNRPDWINSTVESKPDGWIVQGYGGSLDSNVDVWALCATV